MSMKCVACDAEFVGGPIDGHVELLGYPPAPFISATVTKPGPIGGWLLRLLPWKKAASTFAVYEMHESNGRFRYCYAGSFASVPAALACIQVDIPAP